VFGVCGDITHWSLCVSSEFVVHEGCDGVIFDCLGGVFGVSRPVYSPGNEEQCNEEYSSSCALKR
jgi:hypothetical protein